MDKVFCTSSEQCKAACDWRATLQILKDANKQELPLSWAALKDTEFCPGYIPAWSEE